MRVEGLHNAAMSESLKRLSADKGKDFSTVVKAKENASAGVNLPRGGGHHMVQDYAEWYFKLGRQYESASSYKQAISAYEKSYSVKPDLGKAEMADAARGKAY